MFILLLLLSICAYSFEEEDDVFVEIQLDGTKIRRLGVGNELKPHKLSRPASCGEDIINFEKWKSISPPKDEYKLMQSHLVIRHGDRVQSYKKKCWDKPESLWLCGEAPLYGISVHYPTNQSSFLYGNCVPHDLTTKGFVQLNTHGAGFRKRYIEYYDLLPHKEFTVDSMEWILSQIKLTADSSLRVQETVIAFFLGLYPNYHQYKEKIAVPIYVEKEEFEILRDGLDLIQSVCPPLNAIIKLRDQSDAYREFIKEKQNPLNEQSKSILGMSYWHALDCATVHSCHNFEVPGQFTQQMYDKYSAASLWRTLYQIRYPNYVNAVKYRIGPLLKLIYLRMKNMIVTNGRNESKLYVYGGHHSGQIMPLCYALGVDMIEWVPYGSTIGFELFLRGANEYFVSLSYNGNPLRIDQCVNENRIYEMNYNLCEWNAFEKWMKQVTPTIDECPNMKLDKYLKYDVD